MSRWDPDPDEVRDVRPYDFEGAKRAYARASRDKTDARDSLKKASRGLAEAERQYRLALAKRIVELRAEGHAATVASDLAKGDPRVADLRYARDVAAGVLEAAQQEGWQHTANSRGLDRLVDWSARVAFAGEPEPDNWESPIGARGTGG